MTAPREPRLASIASWAVLAASFGLSAATWISLAELAGFSGAAALPVIAVNLRLAWLMPIAVDGYLVVALVLWLSSVPPRVARFARRNTYGAALVGIVAQSAYHALSVHQATPEQEWRAWLAAAVGALPPAVAALAVHMRALIRRESALHAEASAQVTEQAEQVTAQEASALDLYAPTPITSEAAEVEGERDAITASKSAAQGAQADDLLAAAPLVTAGVPLASTPAQRSDPPAPEQAEQAPDRPRTDEDLLASYGDQLAALAADGRLTRYRVEQITGAASRQAERLREQTEQAAAQTSTQDAPTELINGASVALELTTT